MLMSQGLRPWLEGFAGPSKSKKIVVGWAKAGWLVSSGCDWAHQKRERQDVAEFPLLIVGKTRMLKVSVRLTDRLSRAFQDTQNQLLISYPQAVSSLATSDFHAPCTSNPT